MGENVISSEKLIGIQSPREGEKDLRIMVLILGMIQIKGN